MDFINKHWEVIIAILALLTSVVSTIVSFYTFKLQRTHNIKSVKPILQIGQWDYESRLFVTLVNAGSGLAIVKEIKVYNKQDKVENCIYNWLPPKLPTGMNYKEYWTATKEFVMQSGQIIHLIEVPIDTAKPEQLKIREDIRAMLGQLTVKVTYEDIYENKMPIKVMELYQFSRTDNVNSNLTNDESTVSLPPVP